MFLVLRPVFVFARSGNVLHRRCTGLGDVFLFVLSESATRSSTLNVRCSMLMTLIVMAMPRTLCARSFSCCRLAVLSACTQAGRVHISNELAHIIGWSARVLAWALAAVFFVGVLHCRCALKPALAVHPQRAYTHHRLVGQSAGIGEGRCIFSGVLPCWHELVSAALHRQRSCRPDWLGDHSADMAANCNFVFVVVSVVLGPGVLECARTEVFHASESDAGSTGKQVRWLSSRSQ